MFKVTGLRENTGKRNSNILKRGIFLLVTTLLLSGCSTQKDNSLQVYEQSLEEYRQQYEDLQKQYEGLVSENSEGTDLKEQTIATTTTTKEEQEPEVEQSVKLTDANDFVVYDATKDNGKYANYIESNDTRKYILLKKSLIPYPYDYSIPYCYVSLFNSKEPGYLEICIFNKGDRGYFNDVLFEDETKRESIITGCYFDWYFDANADFSVKLQLAIESSISNEAVQSLNELLSQKGLSHLIQDEYSEEDLENISSALNEIEITR